MNRPSTILLPLWGLIVVVAALPRLSGLADTGIFGVDEGRYILDGLSKMYEIENGENLVRQKWSELAGSGPFHLAEFVPEAAERLNRQHPFSPKLGFSYLTGLVLHWTRPWIAASTYIDAIASIVLVGIVVIFVRSIRDWPTGMVSGALLAVSGYSIYYARNPYPQSIASLLFVLAVWAHARALSSAAHRPPRRLQTALLFASGACAGVGFWVHYQIAGALPALAVIHGLTCFNGNRCVTAAKRFVTGAACMAAGFLAVLALAEALTYPWILVFRGQGMVYPHATFLELLWPRLVSQSGVSPNPSGLLLFPYFLGVLEGYTATLAASALLCAGGICAWNRREGACNGRYRTFVYLFVPFLVPLVVFSLKTMQGARTFTFGLPFFMAILATAVVSLWRTPAPYRPAVRAGVAVLLCISTASSLMHIREVLAIRSAYPALMDDLKEAGAPGACAAWSSVLESYLIQEGLEGGSLYRYLGEGRPPPHVYVSDWQELYDRRYPDEAIALPEGARPAAELEHSFGSVFLSIEAFPSYGNTLDNIRFVQGLDLERARKLRVYDLRATGLRAPLTLPGPSIIRE